MESMRHNNEAIVAIDWSKIHIGSLRGTLIFRFNQILKRIKPRRDPLALNGHHQRPLTSDQHNSNDSYINETRNIDTRTIQFSSMSSGTKNNHNWIINTMLQFFVILTIANRVAVSITLRRVDVPTMLKIGDNATLTCHYDLSHNEKLYALKWYRDGKEFYRFLPSERIEERKQAFRMEGIHVDLLRSTDRIVTLNNVNLNSGGNFKCEALIEETFKSVAMERKMNIVDQQRNRLHQQSSNYHNLHHSSSSCELFTAQSNNILLLLFTIIAATLNLIIDKYLGYFTGDLVVP